MFNIKALYYIIKNDHSCWFSCLYKEFLEYVFNLLSLLLKDTLKLKMRKRIIGIYEMTGFFK